MVIKSCLSVSFCLGSKQYGRCSLGHSLIRKLNLYPTFGAVTSAITCKSTQVNMSETEVKLKRLITTRGAHRGQMTKLIKSANEIIKPADTANAQVTGETTVDTSSLVKLRGILDSIYTKLEMLKFLDNDIIDLIPEEELADKIIESDDIIEKYCREIHELDHKIKKLSK